MRYDDILTMKLEEIGLSHRYSPSKNGIYVHLILRKTPVSRWKFWDDGQQVVATIRSEPSLPPQQVRFKGLNYSRLRIVVEERGLLSPLERIADEVGTVFGNKGIVSFEQK